MRTKKILWFITALLVGIIACFTIKLKNGKSFSIDNDIDISEYTKEQLVTKEFSMVEGMWEISEYLGMAVEVAENQESLDEDKKDGTEYTDCLASEYLGKILEVEKNNIELLFPSTELGYNIDDNDDLFFIFRQPADLNIEPPYTCVSIKLKDEEDMLDIIVDSNNIVILCVKFHFFRLSKVIK